MNHYRRLGMVSAATGIAAFLAGCATSDTASRAPTSTITSDAVAAPCAAGLPAEHPSWPSPTLRLVRVWGKSAR
jgi:hypothetical protein